MLLKGVPLVVLACACLLAACAGDGPPPDSGSSRFDTIQQTIFNVNCLSAGCHNATDRSGNMVLVEGQAYSNIVNAVPLNDAAQAAGYLRIVPFDPARSFLLIKLATGPSLDSRFGSPMPLTGPPLSAADIQRIRDWILAGAPPPGTPAASAFTPLSRQPTPTPSPSPTPEQG